MIRHFEINIVLHQKSHLNQPTLSPADETLSSFRLFCVFPCLHRASSQRAPGHLCARLSQQSTRGDPSLPVRTAAGQSPGTLSPVWHLLRSPEETLGVWRPEGSQSANWTCPTWTAARKISFFPPSPGGYFGVNLMVAES